MLEKLFGEFKLMRWAIVALLILFISYVSCEVASAETMVEVGIAKIGFEKDNAFNIVLSETIGNKWIIGMGVIDDQIDKHDRFIRSNMFIYGQRIVRGPGKLHNTFVALGASYFGHTTPVMGSKFNFALTLGYHNSRESIWPDYYVIRHMSNSGTSPPNSGENLFNFGYDFGK